jgi:branched-chain amino acid transport system permease protein
VSVARTTVPRLRGGALRSRGLRETAIAAVVIVLGFAISGSLSEFQAQQWSQWVLAGLLALSFTWVWGHAGIFSFGQAAFYGIGGYTYGVVSIDLIGHTHESVAAVLGAVVVAAACSALLGYFIFYGNVGDVYVAIVTLATSLVLLTVMSSTADRKYHIGAAVLGGYNGMVGVPPLTLPGGAGGTGSPVSIPDFFAVVVTAATLVVLGLRLLQRRPFGRVVAAARENELRTMLLGYDVRRYKLGAFTLGGAIAGLAGAGYAAWGTFINPSVFALSQAAIVAIYVMVGGRTSLIGAFVGVLVVEEISSTLGGSSSTATPIVLGSVLIAVVLLLPQGVVPTLVGFARRLVPALRPRAVPIPPSRVSPSDPAPVGAGAAAAANGDGDGELLVARDMRKAFGGLVALDGVSAAFPARGVHCLIGPNGAGKSTFFNLLVGRYAPTAGEISLKGRRIDRRRPDRRVRDGLGIKLQVASLYDELTTFENMWLAAYARTRDRRLAEQRASDVLHWLELADRAHEPAGVLSHGAQQWLEIGMVIAAEPDVVLLDEPTAGMTRAETARTVALVNALGEHATVIVVEHDMEFVRQLDAPVTMFHEGRVFASGSIAELRNDERVLDVYLGRSARVEA